MDDQTFLNIVLGGLSTLFGWILKILWDGYKSLKTSDEELVKRIIAIELLIAGDYVKRKDLDKIADKIFAKLDLLNERLGSKADKRD